MGLAALFGGKAVRKARKNAGVKRGPRGLMMLARTAGKL